MQQTSSGVQPAGACLFPGNVMNRTVSTNQNRTGFTLVELLLVIAIIAIMASLVISAFSNASTDSRLVLARQQQAVVQQAVNSWIAYKSASTKSLYSARNDYAAAGTTSRARLDLVKDYLDDATYLQFTGAEDVQTDAMARTAQHLEITDWPTDSYPRVNLLSE
jgi:prepilin-type N-terminal cleavage/methylation domain-containing protein